MLVSKADFARQAGVSRAAISKNCKTGLLYEKDGKIPLDHPTNRAYLDAQKEKQAAGVPDQKRRKDANRTAEAAEHLKNGPIPPDRPREPQSGDEPTGAYARKIEEEIRYKQSRTRLSVIEIGEKMGRLIEREVLTKKWAAFDGELRTRFIDLPKRLTPQLIALVNAGSTEKEITEALEAEITDAIRKAKDAAKRYGPESL